MTEPREMPAAEQNSTPGGRVGTIAGDRLCVGCAFNLRGQPIVREDRYGLLVARCPECGTVAPMQEYPVLGRWAARWAALLAGSWAVVMLVVVLGGALGLYGAAQAMSAAATEPLAQEVAGGFFDHVAELVRSDVAITSPMETQVRDSIRQAQAQIDGGVTPGVRAVTPQQPAAPEVDEISEEAIAAARELYLYRWPQVDLAWWEGEPAREYRRRAGGFGRALAQIPFAAWVGLVLPCVLYGAFLSVAMQHRRGTGLVGVALVPAGLALAFSFVWPPDPGAFGWGWGGAPASSIAGAELFGPMRFVVIGLGFGAIVAGMLVGRPLARLVLRLLLPARQRSALAILWTCDGLDPPRPGDGA